MLLHQKCLLLRLEIMEERKAEKELMADVWMTFADTNIIGPEDIDRVIRILTARPIETEQDGLYVVGVVHMIIRTILSVRGGDCQKMIGRLLLTLIDSTEHPASLAMATEVFDSEYCYTLSRLTNLSCMLTISPSQQFINLTLP
jgi:hypothetical protein